MPQLKRYEKAVEWARKAAQVPDTLIPRISVVKISALGHLGRREEARSVADELLGVKPDLRWITSCKRFRSKSTTSITYLRVCAELGFLSEIVCYR